MSDEFRNHVMNHTNCTTNGIQSLPYGLGSNMETYPQCLDLSASSYDQYAHVVPNDVGYRPHSYSHPMVYSHQNGVSNYQPCENIFMPSQTYSNNLDCAIPNCQANSSSVDGYESSVVEDIFSSIGHTIELTNNMTQFSPAETNTGNNPEMVSPCQSDDFVNNLRLLAQTSMGQDTPLALKNIVTEKLTCRDSRPYECQKCSKTFKESYKLKRHSLVHTHKKPHKCVICKKQFTQKYGLKRHLLKIHKTTKNEVPYQDCNEAIKWQHKCLECDRQFKQKVAMERHHQVAHSGTRLYVCHVCNRDFSCREFKQKHMTKIHATHGQLQSAKEGDTNISELSKESKSSPQTLPSISLRPHKCSFCGKGFKNKTKLKRHLVIHTGERKYKCPVCSKPFARNDDVKLHITRKHATYRPFKCTYCFETFSSRKDLKEHKLNHTRKGDRLFVCDVCDKAFPRDSALQSHREKTHPVDISDLTRPHKCSHCSRRFKLRHNLTVHMRIHSGDKPYKCQYCLKCFTYNYTLKIHTRVHTGQTPPNSCNHCGKSFIHHSDLNKHKNLHTGEFTCEVCNKCYPNNYSLETHKRTHTGVRPYTCQECGKQFTQNTYLQSHLRIHSGVKPYKCDFCDSRFTHKNSLKDHIHTHTGEKPHVCEHCGKSFAQLNTLKQHIRIHTGERPYKCKECGKSFSQRNGLRSHGKICQKLQKPKDSVCQAKTEDVNQNKHQPKKRKSTRQDSTSSNKLTIKRVSSDKQVMCMTSTLHSAVDQTRSVQISPSSTNPFLGPLSLPPTIHIPGVHFTTPGVTLPSYAKYESYPSPPISGP